MSEKNVDVLARLRDIAGAAPVLDVLAGEPGVHVVGGAVRDLLLGREPGELDFVVEGDAGDVARRASAALGGIAVVHDRFGTATVRAPAATFDLAAARRERYPRPGALPEVELVVALQDDLARRDFTVNAIAVRLAGGALTAWPGALEDLEAGVLRVLHAESFADDPTRLLRLARYGARLGFEPDAETARLAEGAVRGGAVETVTGARLGSELRLLLRESQPSALVRLQRHGLGEAVLGSGFSVDPDLVSRALAESPRDAHADLVALAACVDPHGLETRLDELAFPGHERDVVVAAATRAHALAAALGGPAADTPSHLWAHVRHEEPETIALAAALGDERARAAARRWLDELRHVRLAITGHDLLAAGLNGPAVGAGLAIALAAALDGRATGRDEQLATAVAAARSTLDA